MQVVINKCFLLNLVKKMVQIHLVAFKNFLAFPFSELKFLSQAGS